MKKIVSIVVALALTTVLSLPVAAADELEQKSTALEEKFGIEIEYDKNSEGKPILRAADLSTLDTSLSKLGAGIVRQVSEYYQRKMGSRITYRYTDTTFDMEDSQLLLLGSFEPETAIITVYMPPTSGALASGSAPITLLHEFAHAYLLMVEDLQGTEQTKKEWMALNGSISNNEGYMVYPYNKTAFISSYAASSYPEDFAETFANVFVRDKAGQGFYHQLTIGEKRTALGRKVDYLEKLLPKYLSGTETAIANLHKINTTPVFLNYGGAKLSGEDLQYIGCASPHNVYKEVMRMHSLRSEEAKWVSKIGGWEVAATDGNYYVVFPGGMCHQIIEAQAVA